MPVYKYGFTAAGTVTAHSAPNVDSATPAMVTSVATPMATYYPLLDITGRDIVDTPSSTTANEAAKPTSTDATTIIVEDDKIWEAEYLKAMEEAADMKKESMSGKKTKYRDSNGMLVKRCSNFCGN